MFSPHLLLNLCYEDIGKSCLHQKLFYDEPLPKTFRRKVSWCHLYKTEITHIGFDH